MKEINTNIGENLKNIRKHRSMTIDQLSEGSGVSKSMISEIERGIRNPSITTIWNLANCLKKPLNYFLTGSDKDSPDIYKINEKNSIRGDSYTFNPLMDFDEDKKFELYFNEYQPGCVTEDSTHFEGVEEFVLICNGSLTLHLENKEYTAAEAEVFHLKGHRKHHYSNSGTEPVKAFTIMYYSK
jgi:XRE family transcriptional regulator, regulator of sulfur utilization